jgi:hypothetical protein
MTFETEGVKPRAHPAASARPPSFRALFGQCTRGGVGTRLIWIEAYLETFT